MKRFALTVLLTAVAAVGTFAQDLSQEQLAKIQELFEQGREHYGEKEYGKSNDRFREILGQLPVAKTGDLDINRATILFNIGRNYALMGKKDTALETLEEAVTRGFWDYEALKRAPDLASLRKEKRFGELVSKSHRDLGTVAFGLKDIAGKELKKKDYESKVLVIDVWGTWCPPCRMEIPHLVRLQKEYKNQGLAVIGLTWERRPPNDAITENVKRFADRYGINYRLIMINEARLSLIPNMTGFPTTLFVGRDGLVREQVAGYRPYEELRARVRKLLKEKAPRKVARRTVKAGGSY